MTPSPLTRWDRGSPVVPLDAIIGTEKEIDFQTLLPAPCIIHSYTQKNTSVPPHALRSEGELAPRGGDASAGFQKHCGKKKNHENTLVGCHVFLVCVARRWGVTYF